MEHHRARKRFGQHFLADPAYIDQIIQAVNPRAGDHLVEIGPGLSALTQPLLDALPSLMVVELDRDLAARLRAAHSPERLRVIESDALQVDFSTLGDRLRVVGNLPYNISTPLLFHLLASADHIVDQHFMLQREVVQRMVAEPGSGDYGRLSVMLQLRYRMHPLFDVPPEAFDPPPRVVSAVVRMIPRPADRLQPRDPALFEAVVARAFTQRRKMLRKCLGDWAAQVDWDAVGVDPTARPEVLSVAQFVALADHLSDQRAAAQPKNQ